eukprot:Gb_23651 [translate_table: standard]
MDSDMDTLKKEKLRSYEASLGGFELKAFEALERDFQEVLQELQADKSLDRFRGEYEKLHRALKKSHESEKRLIKKCRELNTEILGNASRVQNALKVNEEDQSTILALKREIDRAWKMVEASQEKETKAKDNVQQLKFEIANLSQIIEQSTGLSMGQEKELNELMKQKEEACKERDAQMKYIVKLREEVGASNDRVKHLEDQKITLQHEVSALKDHIEAKKADSEREFKKKERMEKEIKELKLAFESKQNEIKLKEQQIVEGQEQVAKSESMLQEQKQMVEKATKELDMVNQKVTELHSDLEEQIFANTQLLAENSQKQMELKIKDDEIQAIKDEVARVNKIREASLLKIKVAESAKEEAEIQRNKLQNDIQALERELEAQKRQAERERKRQEELLRERDLLSKMKTKAESSVEKQADLMRINEVAIRNLEAEIMSYRDAAEKQEKVIQQLERERQKYSVEASQSEVKYLQALDEVRAREMTIIDLQKKIVDGENRLKQQQNLHEYVRSERNKYSKNLADSQDEIEEFKRRMKVMNSQIEQLKEEIDAKDVALNKEHLEFTKVEKEKEALKQDLNRAQEQMKEAEEAIASHVANIESLNHIVSEADDEQFRQKKELDAIESEREVLAKQLMRRNEELTLLYEKIKIEQSTLNQGMDQYNARLNEIRILKIKLADLKRENNILKGSVQNVAVLKQEVHNLGRELLQEQTKVKALSEELENPLNVHRWRQLEGRDPTAYQMIMKIQTLQKRLILKTEQVPCKFSWKVHNKLVSWCCTNIKSSKRAILRCSSPIMHKVVEKDLLIQEKEKLYAELQSILARQPGPEVAEQLSIYRNNCIEKTHQLKAMQSELQMYQVQWILFYTLSCCL